MRKHSLGMHFILSLVQCLQKQLGWKNMKYFIKIVGDEAGRNLNNPEKKHRRGSENDLSLMKRSSIFFTHSGVI